MKLLECYYCDGAGFVHFYEVVDTLEGELYTEDGALFIISEATFAYSAEELLCPDCAGHGWELPWHK